MDPMPRLSVLVIIFMILAGSEPAALAATCHRLAMRHASKQTMQSFIVGVPFRAAQETC